MPFRRHTKNRLSESKADARTMNANYIEAPRGLRAGGTPCRLRQRLAEAKTAGEFVRVPCVLYATNSRFYAYRWKYEDAGAPLLPSVLDQSGAAKPAGGRFPAENCGRVTFGAAPGCAFRIACRSAFMKSRMRCPSSTEDPLKEHRRNVLLTSRRCILGRSVAHIAAFELHMPLRCSRNLPA